MPGRCPTKVKRERRNAPLKKNNKEKLLRRDMRLLIARNQMRKGSVDRNHLHPTHSCRLHPPGLPQSRQTSYVSSAIVNGRVTLECVQPKKIREKKLRTDCRQAIRKFIAFPAPFFLVFLIVL
jgi:hypothetical protein